MRETGKLLSRADRHRRGGRRPARRRRWCSSSCASSAPRTRRCSRVLVHEERRRAEPVPPGRGHRGRAAAHPQPARRRGRGPLARRPARALRAAPAERAGAGRRGATKRAFELGGAAVEEAVGSETDLVIEGQERLLEKPEFQDAGHVRQLVTALDAREKLVDAARAGDAGQGRPRRRGRGDRGPRRRAAGHRRRALHGSRPGGGHRGRHRARRAWTTRACCPSWPPRPRR